ncbi:MAG: cupin domain-containing protein [Armatimonadota bacterium]|nr:cupin domain-containing protein [Armatimonadota bacterium]MDR7464165.1 cupin domain-containing protein [Armatimonadota bacterium]MDR7470372.1 cupin domain-containing protein [Armatimonadota bacterium]MDR7474081.1 cupin domain-containing protein [Armatimonadota bacterium]MDR7539144.1 cupin domain-containing protein [Armatimonadota bacterium]
MAAVEKKSLNQPEERQTPEKARIEAVNVGGLKIQRIMVEPGWQWSKHLKPVVGTESCQKDHLMYIISGKGHARMNDGKEVSFGPGDVVAIPPGHDGWNAGTEPLVWIEIPH